MASWNCQGMRNAFTDRRFWEFRSDISPDVLFLMETKNQDEYIAKIGKDLNFVNSFTVPPQGLSGGLALFWKDDISVEILDSSANLIDVKFKHKQSSFHTTFIYGPPQKENRGAFWDQLGALGESRDSAWVLTGDFNDILDNSEKIGGPPRHEGSFLHFRSFVSQQSL